MKWVAFFCIWVIGCAAADYLFMIEANAYAMLWGYIVGNAGLFLTGVYKS